VTGILVGLVFFLAAFPLLTWNEKRSVNRTRSLREMAEVTRTVDPSAVDPGNEGAAVHFSGRAETTAGVTDETFGIREPALRLRRIAEIYQWKEETESKTEKKVGGSTETTTTYTYRKVWDTRLVPSSGFEQPSGHENPASMRFEGATFDAADVTVGAFALPPRLVGRIGSWQALPAPAPEALPDAVRKDAKADGERLYFGADPANPAIGDHRVRFEVVPPHDVSVAARQAGTTLEPYLARTGNPVELLEDGVHGAEAMFTRAHDENRIVTWLLRLGFFLLMAIGLSLLFRPLSVLADVLPFVGNLVGAGTGLVAFVLAAALSLATIAVAWLAFRPLIGVPLLAGSIALIVFLRGRMRRATPAPAGAAGA
jgi:hypothetical protein